MIRRESFGGDLEGEAEHIRNNLRDYLVLGLIFVVRSGRFPVFFSHLIRLPDFRVLIRRGFGNLRVNRSGGPERCFRHLKPPWCPHRKPTDVSKVPQGRTAGRL